MPLPKLTIPALVIWALDDLALPPGNLDGLDEQVENLSLRDNPRLRPFRAMGKARRSHRRDGGIPGPDRQCRVSAPRLLRDLSGGHAAVSYIELFLDLVYVFAVTQLSHFLLEHLSPLGALQALILFLAVWWAWIYTTWATNWLDPEHGPVRFAIGGVMVGSLVMSSALPYAFARRTGWSSLSPMSRIQVLRTSFTVFAMRHDDKVNARNLARATIYFVDIGRVLDLRAASRPIRWSRALLWAVALRRSNIRARRCYFWVPWLGRAHTGDWAISGGHMAERCALFIIIALGEGIIVTGSQFARQPKRAGRRILAFVTAFIGSFAMWWVYFDLGARRGAEHIEHHADPGRVARDAFTYWHLPIVAGIVVLAVVDEQTLAHPLEASHLPFVLTAGRGQRPVPRRHHGVQAHHQRQSVDARSRIMYGLWLTAAVALWGWLGPSLAPRAGQCAGRRVRDRRGVGMGQLPRRLDRQARAICRPARALAGAARRTACATSASDNGAGSRLSSSERDYAPNHSTQAPCGCAWLSIVHS